MKKRSLLLAGAIAAGLAGYVEYSKYLPGPVPGEEELGPYFDGLFALMGLPDLRHQIEEDWIENDGNRLHLDLLLAHPDDPALVFVPGTSVYALFYAEFMHKMRLAGFNVIGLDPRGHGRSSGVRGSYTIEELMSDARAATDYAIARFGDDVAIAGSSQGGIVSFYAAAADERLKAAVCHNVAVLGEPDSYELVRYPQIAPVASALLPLLAGLAPDFRIPVTLYLDIKSEPTKFDIDTMEFLMSDPLIVMSISLKAMASLATTPPPKPVEEIRVPVMVIHAEDDNIFPTGYVRGIYDRLTCDKEFFLLERVPHLVLTNNVDEVVPIVARWLVNYL